jgi:hypothetical protein
VRSDSYEREITLDQFDWPVLLISDLLEVVLVLDQSAGKAHPTNLCAIRAS